MLARIRQSAKTENDGGFTLIELLVVMIIIGILAAIAIPVFLSQRAKAQDAATKADVSTVGKELATYFVDNTAAPNAVAISGGRYTLTATAGGTAQDLGKVSTNVVAPAAGLVFYGATPSTMWCVNLTNPGGSTQTWKYSAKNGLASGACVAADYS
jgi:prepilin-type N-terminal cleavage/methylation domain-containing protein